MPYKRTRTAPASKPVGIRQSQPRLKPMLPATLKMHNRELLASLASVTMDDFELLKTYRIQPGFGSTFPWFASLAQKFDKYKVHNIKFHFDSICATTTPGRVIFLAYADPNQPAPTSLYDASCAMTNFKSVQVYEHGTFQPDKHIKMTRDEYFVRAPNTTVVDVMKYDIGVLYIFADTVNLGSKIGNLYIEYDITLMNPVPPQVQGQSLGTTMAVADPFRNLNYNFMPQNVGIINGEVMTIKQPGQYLLTTSGSGLGGNLAPTFSNMQATLVETVTSTVTGSSSYVYQILVSVAQAALAEIVLKDVPQLVNFTKVT